MEHKIGTRITLEVVEQEGCKGYLFEDLADCDPINCIYRDRKDGKGIIYKVTEEKETNG